MGLTVAVMLAALTSLEAATWTGTGGSDRWSDAGNWDGTAPGTDDNLVLTGAGRTTSVNDLPTDLHFATLTLDSDSNLVVTGAPLAVDGTVINHAGRNRLECPLVLATEQAIAVAARSELVLAGGVAGSGGLLKRGKGLLVLAAPATYAGATTVNEGILRLGDERACGVSDTPLHLDGGGLEIACDGFHRALFIDRQGGRLDAFGEPRRVASPIVIAPCATGAIVGSYFNTSLRSVTEDDWRPSRHPTGTRIDQRLHFPASAFGSEEERQAMRIVGNASDWDSFSVQWDGFLAVATDGTVLATRSDDGSRVWLDLNHDGVVQPGEWGSNNWGGGQGATTRRVHGPLAAGLYPMRVQFEDGGGPNTMSLLWSDRQHQDGALDGFWVVPASAYLGTMRFTLGGTAVPDGTGQPLTLEGRLSGPGAVVKSGDSTLVLAGPIIADGGLVIDGGTVDCQAPGVLPEVAVELAAQGTLQLRGFDQRLGSLTGAGVVELGGASLTLGGDGRSGTFGGRITGGTLVKIGLGTVVSTGAAIDVKTRLDDGCLHFADGRTLAAVRLQSPLTTSLFLPAYADELTGTITVPPDAPADLGFGVFVTDQHGNWFQTTVPGSLTPGTNPLAVSPGRWERLVGEPYRVAGHPALVRGRTGLFFWSASASRARLLVEVRTSPPEAISPAAPALIDLALPPGPGRTGERWELGCRPQPFPANPYDPAEFSLDAVFTAPDGTQLHMPGFCFQPMRAGDRGDREQVRPDGQLRFVVRFRPRQPGAYRAHLIARWADGKKIESELPPFEVGGTSWDDYVHVDTGDPRFFTCGGRFYWPIGLNLRSTNDPRCQQCLGTKLTPDRGTLVYDAYLRQLGAAGGTATEIWLAAWNLGLEWNASWDGFHGAGRYNQANAWRLDRVLDQAWANGIRVNLVINNHGQASTASDAEWALSPYHTANGGWLDEAQGFFRDPQALAMQERYRRYLVARYADHPAILGWKLWSEVNLTNAGPFVKAWHEQAAARWHALDAYRHPVTTHWSGDYQAVDRQVAALPGLDYVCIDAYQTNQLLPQLLAMSTLDPGQGLGRFGKPILVTEYGGNWNGCALPAMVANHACGAWAALVSGHGGSPLLWWYEWVDQGGRWQPYRAIANFIVGEDLREPAARSIVPVATSPGGELWARAWSRPGRMLGYVLDNAWGRDGTTAHQHDAARIQVGIAISAGRLTVEWWDADRGERLRTDTIDHAGGTLELKPPAFNRHLAFKLFRSEPK
jgi:autotransporter-associated beta strand protein